MQSTIDVTDFDDYQRQALLTMAPGDHVKNLLHGIMGMAGEAGEYTELPATEGGKRTGEVGDCMWYSAALANELGVKFSVIVQLAEDLNEKGCELAHYPAEVRAVLWACRMVDVIKKTVFYGKDPDENKLLGHLVAYVAALLSMAKELEISLLEAGLINIRKLATRYPDLKFDANKATHRDYAAETKAAGVEIV